MAGRSQVAWNKRVSGVCQAGTQEPAGNQGLMGGDTDLNGKIFVKGKTRIAPASNPALNGFIKEAVGEFGT